MSDQFDRATELEELDREQAEARVRDAIPRGDWREISAKWCAEPTCGMRIPDLRRRTLPGVQLCVECAERAERQQRTTRRR